MQKCRTLIYIIYTQCIVSRAYRISMRLKEVEICIHWNRLGWSSCCCRGAMPYLSRSLHWKGSPYDADIPCRQGGRWGIAICYISLFGWGHFVEEWGWLEAHQKVIVSAIGPSSSNSAEKVEAARLMILGYFRYFEHVIKNTQRKSRHQSGALMFFPPPWDHDPWPHSNERAPAEAAQQPPSGGRDTRSMAGTSTWGVYTVPRQLDSRGGECKKT